MKVSRRLLPALLAVLYFIGCASEPAYDPLQDYEEVDTSTIVDAPSARSGSFAPASRDLVYRGEYLVELLGCGSCHTDGALRGDPDMNRALAGSRIGIAYISPLEVRLPGIVYPANLTPDMETGIGSWSDQQIANAIRAGIGRHGNRRIATMPWQAYAKLSDEDVSAIVSYLRALTPVHHKVPEEVAPGRRAKEDYVYFGVYRNRK